jgi:peroxiredoxin Q/BCP
MPLLDPTQPAPSFRLPDQSGSVHTLEQYRGKKIVLYFYPEDDTPKCTDEACGFRDVIPTASSLNAVILGVSPDTSESHAKFAAKFSLPFPLLADVPGPKGVPAVANAYGAWVEKNMYGKKFWGVARVTYLIDEEGKIARRWGRVIVDGHAQEVLEALRSGGSVIEAKPKASGGARRAKPGKKSTAAATRTKARELSGKPAGKAMKQAAKQMSKKTVRRAAR